MFPETAAGDTRGTFLTGAISVPAARCKAASARRSQSVAIRCGGAARRTAAVVGQASQLTKPGDDQAEKVFLG